MKTLRVLRNVAALFILAMALVASWPGVQLLRAQNTGNVCYSDSNSYGYNCTFNADGTCSSSKCQAGQACNNSVCPNKSCGYKKGKNCYINANNQCRESSCTKGWCLNSGCV
jgi:hypothetical protein